MKKHTTITHSLFLGMTLFIVFFTTNSVEAYGHQRVHVNPYIPQHVNNNWAVRQYYYGPGSGNLDWTQTTIPSPAIYNYYDEDESDEERYVRYHARDNHYRNFFLNASGYGAPQEDMNSLYNRLYNHYYYDTRDRYQY